MKKARIYFAIILKAPMDVNGNSRKAIMIFDEHGSFRTCRSFSSEGWQSALLSYGETPAHVKIVRLLAEIKVPFAEYHEALGRS